ncbi:hypothetical protein TNIN_116201 [Trichonephila inaurata madagascariensis]|uniref:DUF4817 domain-containing protein n=1 Tax=Trichonephila inaurata madagascariensis TaxID=2747483 RepID=A0A8X6WQQ9_9ARAC|nr:hypothetical protein TNIN_116201 [Trichonephila inaurata madagascariensis]
MHLAYKAAGESNRRARQVYESHYPGKRIPHNQMFARVQRNMCKRGSLHSNMHDTRRRRLTRTVNVGKRVLQFFEENPNTSTGAIAQRLRFVSQQQCGMSRVSSLTICQGL